MEYNLKGLALLYTHGWMIVTIENMVTVVTLTTPLSSPVVMVFAFTTWSEYIGDLQE